LLDIGDYIFEVVEQDPTPSSYVWILQCPETDSVTETDGTFISDAFYNVQNCGNRRVLGAERRFLMWAAICFQILADTGRHELRIPQRTMRPSIAREQLLVDSRSALQPADIPPPQSTTLDLHPVARKLLLISCPVESRRLS